jgi:hypothetical protein
MPEYGNPNAHINAHRGVENERDALKTTGRTMLVLAIRR